jgi:Protein of unknown function (DUF1501)
MSAPFQSCLNRRQLLARTATGFGALALSALLHDSARADPGLAGSANNPLAVKPPHFPARAKRVIFLFMHGGPSQVDTFDYKPLLIRDHGKPFPFSKPRVQFAQTGNLMQSPWAFQQHGQSGLWVSELFPDVARHADKLCIIKSMHTDNVVHGDAVIQLHTGSDVFVRPSMGSWMTYGLGSENRNLPGYITISPSYAHGGISNWSSAFLPAIHQGTPIGNDKLPIREASIRHIRNKVFPGDVQRAQLDFLGELNRSHLQGTGPDSTLEARIESFELAFRMQTEAPGVMDITNEPKEILDLYGVNNPATADFGQQCLLARRFSERGVRFVQCSHSYKWDQHGNLKQDHAKNAMEVDRPIAALLADLERRGLLHETLVLWGGEFGRTPTVQGNDGRDHNPHGYTMWLAGGGVKGGHSYGATDDYGYYAVHDRVHVRDLHATILHLLGLDHERLTYLHAGRHFRLTDVSGTVVKPILS